MSNAQKRTPLYQQHLQRGAKMVAFAGWVMPLQYTSILEEHQAVRNNVGIFDISHMGQFIVEGRGASEWLNFILTNNIHKLAVGAGQYTLFLNERAGIIDDLIVYRTGDEKFLLVVNAARADEDFAWLERHRNVGQVFTSPASEHRKLETCATINNRSAKFGGVAIQGPRVVDLFRALNVDLPTRNHIVDRIIEGVPVTIARTGYTGEDGLEAFFGSEHGPNFWELVLQRGEQFGIKPCGLGARDTLRLEMCYPLNGSDLSPERNPIEAGLGTFVDFAKPNFIGRDVLVKTKEHGPREKLVPFRMREKGPPPRPHYAVFENGERIGEVTSGTLSPSLNWGIGMAYIEAPRAKVGSNIEIEIRGQKFPAVIETKPLYRKGIKSLPEIAAATTSP
ncbi:MAG TPA: glycine cleavage system aminomethyltransferase GcvT [Chthoniobacterales bacterium]|nr:glycine cleavage system aminomethyltransferase GcvT [Chthoniobacterales bacterium]